MKRKLMMAAVIGALMVPVAGTALAEPDGKTVNPRVSIAETADVQARFRQIEAAEMAAR